MVKRRGRKSNIQKAVEAFVKDIMEDENALIFYALFHKHSKGIEPETKKE